jgi:DNA-formamidopyrimidine glycosylase
VLLGAVRRGKFLWLPIDTGRALVIHLGMSGQVLLREPSSPADRQLRIRLHLHHPGHGELWLNFADQRMFGSMAVDRMRPTADGLPGGFAGTGVGDWTGLIPGQVAHIARDPIDPDFDTDAALASLARRGSGIKRVLLDQTWVSGIGNIYADEALFSAGLHYEQPASSLSPAEGIRLLDAVRTVLQRALAEGGTSFDSQYVNVNGQSGYFSHSLLAYGKQGTACPRCGALLVREQFMNRSSHLCPVCQRLR